MSRGNVTGPSKGLQQFTCIIKFLWTFLICCWSLWYIWNSRFIFQVRWIIIIIIIIEGALFYILGMIKKQSHWPMNIVGKKETHQGALKIHRYSQLFIRVSVCVCVRTSACACQISFFLVHHRALEGNKRAHWKPRALRRHSTVS